MHAKLVENDKNMITQVGWDIKQIVIQLGVYVNWLSSEKIDGIYFHLIYV